MKLEQFKPVLKVGDEVRITLKDDFFEGFIDVDTTLRLDLQNRKSGITRGFKWDEVIESITFLSKAEEEKGECSPEELDEIIEEARREKPAEEEKGEEDKIEIKADGDVSLAEPYPEGQLKLNPIIPLATKEEVEELREAVKILVDIIIEDVEKRITTQEGLCSYIQKKNKILSILNKDDTKKNKN